METKIKAKMNALKSLKDAMSQLIGSDIKGGMKKVTVAADDKAGLEKGLDKAKELLHGKTGDMLESEGPLCNECGGMHEEGEEHEAKEDDKEEASEHSLGEEETDESLEDLQAKLAELKAKIEKKTKK
jgi:hypothetical protein